MNRKRKAQLRQICQQYSFLAALYHKANKIKIKRLSKLSDEEYLVRKYKAELGRDLNLNNPKTFTEKLQWLKLHDRKPIYTQLVDKYKVREYIEKTIGSQYLVPLYGVWDKPEDIDFDNLPEQFILKTNHDSGGVIVCKDKDIFDKKKAIHLLKERMKVNYFWASREWAYKNVERKIIAEEYLIDDRITDEKATGLIDYKFYCFNGDPKFFYLGYANMLNSQKNDCLTFYNTDWSPTEFYRNDHEPFPFSISKPQNWDEMLRIARTLSKGIPFVRVDLFNIHAKIYFSELTFYPGGGFGRFYPEEWETKLGEWIQLPNGKNV